MTKIDSLSASLSYPSASHLERGPARRLIILFPASASDDPAVARRIWEIASSSGLDVLFIGLCNEYNEEAQLRRKLVTMAAIIRDGIVSADIMIEGGSNWVAKAKRVWRPGDALACYGGQKVGLMRKTLDQVLRSSVDAPLYILADEQPTQSAGSKVLAQVLAWVGSLAIIAGFFWAEVQLVKLPGDWAHTALLYLCVLVEVGLIWGWNSLLM